MKKHQRIAAAFAALLVIAAVSAGCRKKAADPLAGMTTGEIVAAIYEKADVELPVLTETAIDAENMTYYLGTDQIKIKEGTASEPLINAIAYSLCVIRLESADDSAEARKLIAENADPRKWVCVCVDEQNVVVDGASDVVVLIMSEESTALDAAFQAVAAPQA